MMQSISWPAADSNSPFFCHENAPALAAGMACGIGRSLRELRHAIATGHVETGRVLDGLETGALRWL